MKKVLFLVTILAVTTPISSVRAEEGTPLLPSPVSAPMQPIQPIEPMQPQLVQPMPYQNQSDQPVLYRDEGGSGTEPYRPTDRQPMPPQQPRPFQGNQPMPPQSGQDGDQPNMGRPEQDMAGGQREQMSSEFKAEIMKKWAAQMERSVSQNAKRISNYEAKKIPVSAETKDALTSLRAIIESAKSSSEDEAIDMGEVNDLMQTLNEGLRNADIAAQFPKVMKEAVREITRQNSLIKKAVAKVPKLKIDVASLIEEWKKDVADMIALKDEAQKSYDAGDVSDAVESLRGDFFELSRDANEKGRTFDMVSNVQQMIKSADKDIKTFTSQIAKLKKKGKDVTELENIIANGKAKIAELKSTVVSGDPDLMIDIAEELNGLKMDFEEVYYGITGQSVYGAFGQMPAMPSLQGPAPQQNSQYFNPAGGNAMPQNGGQTCNINGIEMPGNCKDIEKKMNTQDQGATAYGMFQKMIDWFRN